MSNVHALVANPSRELGASFGDIESSCIVAGGIPVTSGTTTVGAHATTGYIEHTDGSLIYVSQASTSIGALSGGDGTYWLALHTDLYSTVGSWTRQTGTHYLWIKSATRPAAPTNGVIYGRVVVTASAVAFVADTARRRLITGTLAFTASLTIDEGGGWMIRGGSITVSTGVNVTCNASVEAGLWQWISLTGTGKITFTNTAVSPEWWGAVRDGTTSDLTPILAAFAASKEVVFSEGTYWLGTYTTSAAVIDLTGLGDGIRVRTRGKVTLTTTTNTNGAIPRIFFLNVNNNFYCEPICFADNNVDIPNQRGAVGFYLSNLTNQSNWGNLTFESITCTNMIGAMFCVANPVSTSLRIRGIHIGHLNSYNCYYGFNCQNDGDSVVIDNLTAYQNVRPYYVYGVQGHTVSRLFNRHPRPSTGQCYIARQVGGLDTKGIKVDYTCTDSDAAHIGYTHVAIDHIDLLGGTIADIDINVSISNTAGAYSPVYLRNYTGSGGSETTAASSNYTRDIRLSGSCDTNAINVPCVATYAAKRQMNFVTGLNFLPAQSVYDNFQLNQLARAYAPTWGADSVAPAIGNGTLTADIDITNGVATASIQVVMGSTTTYGTGNWYFQTGYGSKAVSVGSAIFRDSGTNFRVGTCRINAGATAIYMYFDTATNLVDATRPFTWASGDELYLTITFPVSG